MNIDPKRTMLAAFALAALSGCTFDPQTGHIVPVQPELGEASKQTFAAQVVDPDPHYPAPATVSGDQTARAVEAYREGKVEEPKAQRATSGLSGSGSGGSGGSGGSSR
jgi:type IV pilus biogenesis protein CpaD/CtpE